MLQPDPRAFRAGAQTVFPLLRMRYWLVCAGLLFWVSLIVTKLFWLQILRHAEFMERAQKQQLHTFDVAPRRGVLYDRNLRELAMTVQADSIWAVPMEIENKPTIVHELAQIVHSSSDATPLDAWTSESQILGRVNASRGFAWIARRVTPEIAARVKALNLKGVYFQKEFQRFYPDNEIAAQVLGYVGVDDDGLGGIERKFDGRLHGQAGKVFAAVDARRRVLGSTVKEPLPGENLMLTIDENIQFIAERALDDAMSRTHAADGTVVIQDVHTGQILALAIRPTFNPNDFRHTTAALLRNHAVSDVYEPGSTFKLVTYAAAIDQKIVKPDDKIDCQGGAITFNGRTIHDDKSDHYGVITVHEALEHSSDVAAVKLALRMGPDHFYDYIHNFGFGIRSGMELPGETRGLLRPPPKWGATSIGSIAIGQEVAVTPLQLVSMVSTIANGGIYLSPHVVMSAAPNAETGAPAVLKPQPFQASGELPSPLPAGAHRVISTLAAAEMRKMMEGVVLYGTGKPARLNGYSSGGKTGTAQKIDPLTHRYSKTMHVASFAGIAPVNAPVIAVAVILDNPKGDYYGGVASAPVFAQVAQRTLEHLGIAHDVDLQVSKPAEKSVKPRDVEPEQEHTGDVSALMAAVNDLPTDDPLREAVDASRAEAKEARETPATRAKAADAAVKGELAAEKRVKRDGSAAPGGEGSSKVANTTQTVAVPVAIAGAVKVPALVGKSVREVVEQVAMAGLMLQVDGRGLVRSQEPAAGSAVRPGAEVIVHCAR